MIVLAIRAFFESHFISIDSPILQPVQTIYPIHEQSCLDPFGRRLFGKLVIGSFVFEVFGLLSHNFPSEAN